MIKADDIITPESAKQIEHSKVLKEFFTFVNDNQEALESCNIQVLRKGKDLNPNNSQISLDPSDEARIDGAYLRMIETYISHSAKNSNTPLVEYAVCREIDLSYDTRILMLKHAIELIP